MARSNKRRRILILSDFRMALGYPVGGYSTITEGLAMELGNMGHEVKVLGFSYERQPHNYNFSVIPYYSSLHLGIQLKDIIEGWRPSAVIVMLDLPQQIDIWAEITKLNIRYLAIYPVEGAPVPSRWADAAANFDVSFVLSPFGVRTMAEAGVTAYELEIPHTVGLRAVETEKERDTLKDIVEKTKLKGRFVVTKVADNHQRKNWADTIINFAEWDNPGAVLMGVTRPDNPHGWYLEELISEVGGVRQGKSDKWVFSDNKEIRIVKDISRNDLAWLYNTSTVLLMDTGAEGMGMPILEAFKVKLPVVGMMHTAIADFLSNGRGIPMDTGYEYRDTFGNMKRYFINKQAWLDAMNRARDPFLRMQVANAAHEFIIKRTWNSVANQIVEAL